MSTSSGYVGAISALAREVWRMNWTRGLWRMALVVGAAPRSYPGGGIHWTGKQGLDGLGLVGLNSWVVLRTPPVTGNGSSDSGDGESDGTSFGKLQQAKPFR